MAERKVYKHYKPEWEQVPPPPASFRSILKWGDPNEFKEPNERLFTFMKQELGLTDADFQRKGTEGHEAVPETLATPPLELEHVAFFESVCGKENVSTKGYNRLSVAYGKTMYDLYRLRENITENVPRAVLYPSSHGEIVQIVEYCQKQRIPLYVYGGLYLTGYPAHKWEEGRFTDPYLRKSLQDYGIIIDTMECSVTWEMMGRVHEKVRAFAKSRPNTVCMTHLSHAYEQGANLYFIFIGKFCDKEEYAEYQFGIFDNIMEQGAAMSHHHGVGKMRAAWVEQSIGTERLNIFRALKKHFDPDNIMNPGGTLGIDMTEAQKRTPKFCSRTWDNPAY